MALKIPGDDNQKLYDSLINEYLFAATHRHPALLKPLDILFESEKPIIVNPLLNGMAIDEYMRLLKIENEASYIQTITNEILASILEAAGFIHFSGYCYNDFKPANIITYDLKGRGALPEIALIDFNLVSLPDDSCGRKGTLHYLAPEVMANGGHTKSSDIYALGVLFYQLITGRLPFASFDESELIGLVVESGNIDFVDS